MDRHTRLAEAYQRAYLAGEELLEVLRLPLSPPTASQVEELVARREVAVRDAVELFQPQDQVRFREQLDGLIVQQRALDREMQRFMAELEKISQAAAQVRASVRGARQVMQPMQRGKMLDRKR